MSSHRFYQLDVFTSRPLTGNPLAVFPDARGLTPDVMQALAREMNLSETTFVTPSERATRRVRFYTPAAEVPLAGHPTIGTWWLLAELGQLALGAEGTTEVTQEIAAGVLPVYLHSERGVLTRVVMRQADPQFGPTVTDTVSLGQALGGREDLIADHPPPQVVSTGLPQLMVPIRSLDALRDLPSGGTGGELAAVLRRWGTDCAMCYTQETESPDATVHCRMFAPGLGVSEDPATGSASGALGAYLVHHALVAVADRTAHLVVEQGIEIGRPGTIHVEIRTHDTGRIAEVRVGGSAVTILEGEVRL